MKILVVTQYFWPEEFLINDFVLSLQARSYEVEVLTGLPNYPTGRFFRGYGLSGPYREEYDGIPVWRSPLLPRGNGSGLRLTINFVSFAMLASIRGLFARNRGFDAIFVFGVSPITVGIPARVMKALTGAKIFFWVQDLWPDSLSATGAIRSEWILEWAGKLTRWTYRGSDCVLIKSQAYRESVLKYGARGDHVHYFPDWAEDLFQPVSLSPEAPEHALMPPGFRVMFAGNIGKAQDFETILAAAEMTRSHSAVQWIIVGDGRHRSWVQEEIRSRALTNVHLLGRHPKEKMPAFFSFADVMLVSLKREPIFSLTVPLKVQSYLACGKPVLASLDGEGSRIIQEAQAGMTVPAESPRDLADAAMKLAELGPERLAALGRNARSYFEANFPRAYLLDQFERWLHEYCSDGHNSDAVSDKR